MSDSAKAAAPAPVLGASGKEVCRAFRNKGECRYANECKYEHSKGDPITVPARDFKPKGDCHSWEKDKACKFGDRCRFLHGADDKRETYRPARPEKKADNAGGGGKPREDGQGGDGRRRRRRRGGPRGGGGGGGGGGGQGGQGGGKPVERKQTPKPAAQYDKDGMEICRKHQQGACRFGQECTYSHGVPYPKAKPKEPKDQKDGGRPRRQRRRRAPGGGGGAANGGGGGGGAGGDKDACFDFVEKRSCEYGDDCRFRHGAGDKRDLKKVRRRTNGPCYALRDQGKCEYGDDCRFSHDPADQDHE